MTGPAGLHVEIRGVVQGVGFRPWVYGLARELELVGTVRNGAAGVTIEAWGEPERLARFVERLRAEPPPGAILDHFRQRPLETGPPEGSFRIVESEHADERRVSIPPDLAICNECRRELFDPEDRRYRYPFVNCTHCGPRFTIALDVPYDRPATTMAAFALCPDCEREYRDPSDRRFHAQPVACPVCGPRARLLDASGAELAVDDPLGAAARGLLGGQILAVKGLGGFHLACRADRGETVARLRERKRRDAKPFAVMVVDLESARTVAEVDAQAATLLQGPEAPIVLLPARTGVLADEVAPGLDLVGLMLPYTPLHHLLLQAVAVPLVMTSANLSDEPIVHRDEQALERLHGLADAFLVHDREIASRCDDSVVRPIAGAPVLLRRSRGYVPRAVILPHEVTRPTLGVGAQLKNTFCLAVGDTAYLGPHIGDLDDLGTYDVFRAAIERMERFLGVEAEVLGHDLHPEYLSTRYARERGLEASFAVQHHHAHLASALAEHGLDGPAVGVIFDGTGYGPDGTAWGGEILVGDALEYRRIATLRPLPLAGNERAIRDVWRLALVLLDDAWAETGEQPPLERLALFEQVPAEHVKLVRTMVERRLQCPIAHGAGRYFDAFGALAFAQPTARYESELALRFERLADRSADGEYPWRIDRDREPWQIDLRPTLRAAAEALIAGEARETVAGRVHTTIAAATADVVRSLREIEADRVTSRAPVVASGGCFANALLSERSIERLSPRELLLHRRVPPGDGGIAVGQVLVADARFRQEHRGVAIG